MIPVLKADQVRAVDAATIRDTPIASIDLMERAAARCTEFLLGRYPSSGAFLVLAGMGNNGGDGLAIARQLHAVGRRVRVVVLQHRAAGSPDQCVNVERARAAGVPLAVADTAEHAGPEEVVIDALLGTGTDRPLEGLLKQVVMTVNTWQAEVVAIDLPTGLFGEDNTTNDLRAVMRATHTLAFELPKLAFLLPEAAPAVGRWHTLPIGLDQRSIAAQACPLHVVESTDALRCVPDRPVFGHKGTFGHALLMVGSTGKMGAALLATEAALASGAGLITARVPAGSEGMMHSALPPALVQADPGPILSEFPVLTGFSAIGIGPGIGVDDATGRLLKRLIQDAGMPLVLDADAINLLSANPTWLAFLPPASILTPHPKEFDRLAGPSTSGHERLQKARDLAQRRGIIIVLKGAFTAICAADGRVFFNPTGNAGMAKGGSGDVLTGLLTGLLAQGIAPEPAAILGVYLHGLAGDLAAATNGQHAMDPRHLLAQLPAAWKALGVN